MDRSRHHRWLALSLLLAGLLFGLCGSPSPTFAATEVDPDAEEAFFSGIEAMEAGKLTAAVELFERARAIDATFRRAWFYEADVWLKLGDTSKAWAANKAYGRFALNGSEEEQHKQQREQIRAEERRREAAKAEPPPAKGAKQAPAPPSPPPVVGAWKAMHFETLTGDDVEQLNRKLNGARTKGGFHVSYRIGVPRKKSEHQWHWRDMDFYLRFDQGGELKLRSRGDDFVQKLGKSWFHGTKSKLNKVDLWFRDGALTLRINGVDYGPFWLKPKDRGGYHGKWELKISDKQTLIKDLLIEPWDGTAPSY